MQRLILPLLALALMFSGNAGAAGPDPARLAAVLQAQPSEVQARYPYRHPAETLTFFEVGPGMSVVEALPGGGWYTRILLPYLGPDGELVGADYSADMYPLFGFFTPEQLKEKETWVTDWPLQADEWGVENSAWLGAFVFGSMPASMNRSADVVLFIRALHNLARFESQGGYLTAALQNAYDILKPGGILGVVQHQAPAGMPDGWAGGQNGYLEKAWVIARLEEAGFEFVAESNINENPKDQPGPDDIVWRLPPTYATSRDNPELKAEMDAIGESNRMTLKFRKPTE